MVSLPRSGVVYLTGICIKRAFQKKVEQITTHEMDLIFDYVTHNKWYDLANSVSKIPDGTEKEGIGKFMFYNLGWDQTKSQLSSHLGAIFSRSGIWEYNGKIRGIQFRRNLDQWREPLRIHCQRSLSSNK